MFISTINYFLSIFKGAEFATTPIPHIITFFGTLINVHRARSVVDDVPRTPIQSCVMTIFMSLAGHTFMSLLIDMRPSWINTDIVIIFHVVAWYLLRFPKFFKLVERILPFAWICCGFYRASLIASFLTKVGNKCPGIVIGAIVLSVINGHAGEWLYIFFIKVTEGRDVPGLCNDLVHPSDSFKVSIALNLFYLISADTAHVIGHKLLPQTISNLILIIIIDLDHIVHFVNNTKLDFCAPLVAPLNLLMSLPDLFVQTTTAVHKAIGEQIDNITDKIDSLTAQDASADGKKAETEAVKTPVAEDKKSV